MKCLMPNVYNIHYTLYVVYIGQCTLYVSSAAVIGIAHYTMCSLLCTKSSIRQTFSELKVNS